MTEVNPPYEWVDEQLSGSGLPENEQQLVRSLLDQFWVLPKSSTGQQVLEAFNRLAQGHTLVRSDPEGVWVQARPGGLVIRDRVRVCSNAYKGQAGVVHNGREGVIVAIRSGDILVRYADGKETRHSPFSLEKRVR